MSEPENETTTRKVGRPVGAKTRGKRRNYKEEHDVLQYRAIAARDILTEVLSSHETQEGSHAATMALVKAAVRLLPNDV